MAMSIVLANRKYSEGDGSPFLDLSGCLNLESYTLGLWARSLYNSRTTETELQSVCTSIESLPQSSLPLRSVTVALHLVTMEYFDPKAWVATRHSAISLLEESLRRLMDRCTPPLAFITVHSTIMVEDDNTSNEKYSIPLVHEMFPALEREGRIRIRPFSDSVWRSLYVLSLMSLNPCRTDFAAIQSQPLNSPLILLLTRLVTVTNPGGSLSDIVSLRMKPVSNMSYSRSPMCRYSDG